MKPVIEQNDVLEWARTYDGPKFHALICDPPYHLTTPVYHFQNTGSGSECIGAMRAGWEEVLGIEREEEYADIARRRIEYWFNKQTEPAKETQPNLFDGRQG